jgi:hypothetical protein
MEEILLHICKPVGNGVASPQTKSQLLVIQDLKKADRMRQPRQLPARREIGREVSRDGRRSVDVMVPAGLLRPGGYLVSIQRDAPGAAQELTAVTFVVRQAASR